MQATIPTDMNFLEVIVEIYAKFDPRTV